MKLAKVVADMFRLPPAVRSTSSWTETGHGGKQSRRGAAESPGEKMALQAKKTLSESRKRGALSSEDAAN